MEYSVKSVGSSERVSSVSVRSGYACHAAQAVHNSIMVCSTYDDHVLVSTSDSQSVADFDTIMPCNHQEADSRIFLYLSHAAQQSHSKAFIRTVDSDVVIIAVEYFGSLGVALELEKPSNTSQFMKSPKHLVLRSRCHVHCFIRSRGVIRRHRSLVSGRRQPGQHGRHTLTLRKHYSLFLMILRS